ncbi:nuclear transport factor 2 family protein (plasmid) [Hymenobacter sp. BRD128]|uniref:nuclear transport factor 2 family protein n=1 Tax=Hymenobacter sp. BRD128 TaxID=2675878 RepID=UPI00156390D7|nr:nuclear transport factor 2 family protein [Hymenobacter sp. BRD128]QKG59189.1 nuclear transport factor 2 family protein [Hymenobacter sp. BRD128]
MNTLPDVKGIAKQYINLSNAVDYNSMADLFAEEAEWIPISPIEPRTGREAIRAGYLAHVKSKNRLIINARYYADGLTCVVEFEVQLEAGEIASIVDIFTFNERGEISRLAIYKR